MTLNKSPVLPWVPINSDKEWKGWRKWPSSIRKFSESTISFPCQSHHREDGGSSLHLYTTWLATFICVLWWTQIIYIVPIISSSKKSLPVFLVKNYTLYLSSVLYSTSSYPEIILILFPKFPLSTNLTILNPSLAYFWITFLIKPIISAICSCQVLPWMFL